MKKRMMIFLSCVLLFSISFISAGYSIDISGLKNDEYTIGEEMQIKVILLEDGNFVENEVDLILSDALNKKDISKKVFSNQIDSIKIDNDFPSGLWTIKAKYGDVEVTRDFLVGENSEVEFKIEGDELIIKNAGNVRYTKTLQITIGDKTNSYAQNIGIGEEKTLKLISPEGSYNIVVTDGVKTIRRENVQLHGTGNVVGAVNKDLVGYTGFAGADDLGNEDNERFISLSKLPLTVIFIGAVFVLIVLIVIERKLSKKESSLKRGKKSK